MKKAKKLIKLLIVFAAVLACLSFHPADVEADDSDFEDNYDYYCELCSTKSKLTEDEKTVCTEFKAYEEKKSQELSEMLEEAKSNLDEMKANITSQGAKIAEYNSQIETLEKQINAINNSITTIETNIEELNLKIQERQEKIDNLNTQIKERMVASQANIRTNSYIKFIMGATSFIDMLRRISAINEITAYDMEKIDEMQQEKELMQADIDEMQSEKDSLIEQQSEMETKKAAYQNLVDVANELINEFRLQEAAFEDQMDAIEKDKSELDAQIDEINNALNTMTASYGFGQFFKNTSFWVSTEAFYYSTGGFHAALDCAVSIGTSLYPIANGVVIDTGTGCAYNGGYMGNTCNWGRGNYIFYLCQIGNKYYFVMYDHLTSVNVSVGQTLTQGYTLMGTTGNSGNSSGAHLHLAIYYMGTTSETSVSDIIRRFEIYDSRFGLANNYTGTCDYRGYTAPCYLNPTDIYGYKYGRWYYVGS